MVRQEGEVLYDVKFAPLPGEDHNPSRDGGHGRSPSAYKLAALLPAATMVESIVAPPVKKPTALLPLVTMLLDWLRIRQSPPAQKLAALIPAATMLESFAAPPIKKPTALLPAVTMLLDWLQVRRGVVLSQVRQLVKQAAPTEKEAESPTRIRTAIKTRRDWCLLFGFFFFSNGVSLDPTAASTASLFSNIGVDGVKSWLRKMGRTSPYGRGG